MKKLVLLTCAFFAIMLGGLSLHQAVTADKPLAIQTGGNPSMGSAEAPVEIVAFEDFYCRTCREFSQVELPQIQSAFIEKGIARFVMIPLAATHESKVLANAALAVYHISESLFFPFVHELFARFPDRHPRMEDLEKLAELVGVADLSSFKEAVREGSYFEQIEENLHIAKRVMKKNLRTPALYINGMATDALSFDEISDRIDQQLSQGVIR